MHLDHETVGRDRDHLADCALPIVTTIVILLLGSRGSFFGAIASITFRTASSMRSLGRCGMNSSIMVSK
jgi:hypothetical protein